MKVQVQLDSDYQIPEAFIKTSEITEKIVKVQKMILSENFEEPFFISAWDGDFLIKLKAQDIYRFFSSDKKVYVQTENEVFLVKMRLYEIEELLQKPVFARFARISNTDIINFEYVKNFDMSLAGTICVNFKNKTSTFVSRRYVSKIKNWLGV